MLTNLVAMLPPVPVETFTVSRSMPKNIWKIAPVAMARAKTIMIMPKKISHARQGDFSDLELVLVVLLVVVLTVLVCFGLTLAPAGLVAGFLAGLVLVFVDFAVVAI